ncbi:MAG: kinase inhibitor [Candidatus Didemnitutus sp.]|nr:kinase inhibitor [Candidatus Didemnitutus sp.]
MWERRERTETVSWIAMKISTRSLTGWLTRFLAALLTVGLIGFSFAAKDLAARSELPATFRLLSTELTAGGRLPEAQVLDGFGYHGGNRSPHLRWENAPAGAKSFVVTLYDPDAPTGSGWWHWVVIDLPADTRELTAGASGQVGALPRGAREMRTDFGTARYGGAAPPPGPAHRYVFTVHALDVSRLDVPDDASAAMVGFFVHQHALGSATLTVNYGA